MTKKLEIDSKTLENLYIKQGLSAGQIAKKYSCWSTTILNHLKKLGIPIRNPKIPLYPNKSSLLNLYINKKLSPYSIAPILGCSPTTVRNWLVTYKFQIRKKNLIKISEKHLVYLYHDKKLSLSKIGELLDCTPSGILKFFNN